MEDIHQKKIRRILNRFSEKKLEKITEDNFSFKKMSRRECKMFMDCVWLTLGKEQATDKEMKKGIIQVLVLATLESFRRKGLVKINKDGNFQRTKLGEDVKRFMDKKENISPPNPKGMGIRNGRVI